MKNMIFIAAFIAMAASAGTLPASAGEEKPATLIDAAFVAGKCTVCHHIDKICSGVGKKNQAQWKAIVTEMVERGAALDESEQKQTSDFITALPRGKNSLCP